MTKLWRFEALDTLFFRESRPMESIGNAELSSVFPPPIKTIVGAIRNHLGEKGAVDWNEFQTSPNHPLKHKIGGDDPLGGPLSFQGCYVIRDGERLFPVPSNLDGHNNCAQLLQLGQPVTCDLGDKVQLPKFPKGAKKLNSLIGYWLKQSDFEALLKGQLSSLKNLVPEHQSVKKITGNNIPPLYVQEPRLGIAIDNNRRMVEENMLYQTRHIRPSTGLGIEVEVSSDVEGYDCSSAKNATVRLGAEGRIASVCSYETSDFLAAPEPHQSTKGIILYLLTPAYFPIHTHADSPWHFLENFKQQTINGKTTWIGTVHGISLQLHMAFIGKLQREGGWSLLERRPRALKGFVPAGSCWYFTVQGKQDGASLGEIAHAITKLHGSQIGEEQRLGRGRVAVGLWEDK